MNATPEGIVWVIRRGRGPAIKLRNLRPPELVPMGGSPWLRPPTAT